MGRAAAVILAAIAASAALSAPAEAQTRRAWAQSANAICTREFAKVHAAVEDATLNPPRTIAQWTRFVDRMVVPMRRARREIGALERPPRDRAAIGSALAYLDRALSELNLARAATVARRFSAYQAHMKKAVAFGGRADAVFRRLGANVCADG